MNKNLKKKNVKTINIGFDLEIEEDGWPPISTEILQGLPLGDDKAKIDNTPFFVSSIAHGDIIEVYKSDSSEYYHCKRLIQEGGNYALSIILRNHEHKESIVKLLSKSSEFYEYGEFGKTIMYAVSLTNDRAYKDIKANLDSLEKKEIISYAELCLA